MTIAIGNDHAGTEYKFEIVKFLEEKGCDEPKHIMFNCARTSTDFREMHGNKKLHSVSHCFTQNVPLK